jgi:magnesium transporter
VGPSTATTRTGSVSENTLGRSDIPGAPFVCAIMNAAEFAFAEVPGAFCARIKSHAVLPTASGGPHRRRIIRLVLADSAVYAEGKRAEQPRSLADAREASRRPNALVWIALDRPAEEEFAAVANEFGLPELAVEDAVEAHQRPKAERHDGTLFVVLRPARYVDETETVEFSEAHVFVGEGFVVTVRHGEVPAFSAVRRRVESEPELLRRGPAGVLHAIMDRVVDDYGPVVAGLREDIEGVEAEVFSGHVGASRRIYKLSREVQEFQRAVEPLNGVLERLIEDGDGNDIDPAVRGYLRDVLDHTAQATEQIQGFRAQLSDILGVNLTLVGIRQNDQTKKISAWAAILFAPTLVAAVYGMNFNHMPELHWLLGYPFALSLMLLVSVTLYVLFKRAGWL